MAKEKHSNRSVSLTVGEHAAKKNHLWYIGVGILLIGFLILTINAQDYLMTAVVLASAIALYRLANLKSESRQVTISEDGIQWGKEYFGYHSFRAFWIDQHGDNFGIYLERLNFRPTISLTTKEDKLDELLEILIEKLPFHSHRNTPLPEHFSRLLKL